MSEDEIARLCSERDGHVEELQKLEREGGDQTRIDSVRERMAETLRALANLQLKP